MHETTWFIVAGGILIFMGIIGSTFKHLPASSAMVYLVTGFVLGPMGFGLLNIDISAKGALLRQITELAILVSLFAIGLRTRVPPKDRIWLIPLRLGLGAMIVTIAIAVVVFVFVLGMTWGPALLLAAILAPTDPVLAHEVQVQSPGDVDLLRFSLTGEGGLNDGIALPFALLGIAVCNYEASPTQALSWHFAGAALWGVVGAMTVGWLSGNIASRFISWLRTRHTLALGPEGFYALGVIAVSYGVAELINTYAFLAVFAAGLAIRRVEQASSGDKSAAQAVGSVDPEDVGAAASDPNRAQAFMAASVLGFTVELERIGEMVVMLMVGSAMAFVWPHLFAWPVLITIVALFFIARPIAVQISMLGTGATSSQRWLISWFGIRGVGSFYYLLYAFENAPKTAVMPLAPVVLGVIAASVIAHGITSTPLMNRYRR